MQDKDYKKTIEVSTSAEAAYLALSSNIENWWATTDKAIQKVGDRSKFSFPGRETFWIFEAEVLVPNEKVELKCIEAYHKHDDLPETITQEWLDTKLVFEIKEAENMTLINFTHVGLNSGLICFDVCIKGWDYFFLNSLAAYLNTGTGTPMGSS